MFPKLPEDVIDAVRAVFATANDRVSDLMMKQPAMHEEGLDFHLVSKLDEVGALLVPSGTAVAIETHWLGGRRHWGRWEISDIAIVIVVRAAGGQLVRKVALLQTKRLYTREIPVETRDRSDYEIGIGRLVDKGKKLTPLFHQRKFTFTSECVYGALQSGSEQITHINDYTSERGIPVYYALYNPSEIPSSGVHPQVIRPESPADNVVGCRVLTNDEVNLALDGLPIGTTPTFGKMVNIDRKSTFDPFAVHGWRLENFIADEVMRCREGRIFDGSQDEALEGLLYRRSAPITSAIVVTIDLPESELKYDD
jgi:hypothetical protein